MAGSRRVPEAGRYQQPKGRGNHHRPGAPDQLFLAAVYALLIVAPLAHVDGAVPHRLFGNPMARQLRIIGEQGPRSLFQEWL